MDTQRQSLPVVSLKKHKTMSAKPNGAAGEPLPVVLSAPTASTKVSREALIAQAAYFRAQQRGFELGHELEDWLAAEAQVDMSPQMTR